MDTPVTRSGFIPGLLIPLLLLTACDQGGEALGPMAPEPPAGELVDGNNEGAYAGFLWLAPLVSSVDKQGQTPIEGLAPTIDICEVVQDAGGWYCGDVIRSYSHDQIVYDADHYKVEWDTQDPDYVFEPSTDTETPEHVYRILVQLNVGTGPAVLGYADVALGENGGAAKNLTTNGLVGLKDGRTLPINFFIGSKLEEQLCGAGFDCLLGTAYAGQDNYFITRDGDASLFLPSSSLPSDEGPYTVLIRELPEELCDFSFPGDLPAGSTLEEFPSCYEYSLDPDPVLLDFATVGQCVSEKAVADYEGVAVGDPAVEERIHELQLGARHSANQAERPDGVNEYELLRNVASPMTLTCEDYAEDQAEDASSSLAAAWADLKRGVRDFLLGEKAWAGDIGLGGSARELSIVKWVDPGVRVAGFNVERGGLVSPLNDPLSDALDLLVLEYGQVWRTTAYRLQDDGVAAAPEASEVGPLLHGHVDLVLLGTVKGNSQAIEALDPALEQPVLAQFVDAGGCAILLPDNDSFGGGQDAVNESLIDAFDLDITGTLNQQQTATVTTAGASHPATAGLPNNTFLQNYPGWFDGWPASASVLATNPGGPAAVVIPGGLGTYGTSGPVFAFSDANQFFGDGNTYAGKFSNAANQQLFLQTVAACGTEPGVPSGS